MKLISVIRAKLQIKFVKNFLTLFSGSVLAEAILFGLTPVLTRLYAEDIFGLFFMFSALAGILRVIASLRFEHALVLPKKDSHAVNLLIVAFIVNVIINAFLLLAVVIFIDFFSQISESDNLGIWYYFLPLSSFLLAGFEIISAWSNRTESYKNISYGRVSKSLMTGGGQIAISQSIFKKSGLFVGLLFGQFVSFIVITLFAFRSIAENLPYVRFKRILVLVRKYKDIPIYNTLLSVLSVLSQQLPLLMLGFLFGASSAGLYGLATRVVASPMGLISDAVGKLFYKTATDIANDKKDMRKFVRKSFSYLFKLALPLFALVIGISFFLEDIFGEGWRNAGIYTRMLLPWLFLSFLHNPVSWVITVLNKQKILTVANLVLIIARFLAIYITWMLGGNSVFAVAVFSAVSFLYSSFIIVFILKISERGGKAY